MALPNFPGRKLELKSPYCSDPKCPYCVELRRAHEAVKASRATAEAAHPLGFDSSLETTEIKDPGRDKLESKS